MKNSNNIFYIVIFLVIVGVTGLLSVAHAPIRVSDIENRRLTALPSFSWEKVLDASYQKQMEEGMKDQSLIKRPSIRIAVTIDAAFGRQDRNGAYFDNDGTYVKMETENDYNASRVALNTHILRRFSEESGLPVDICMIPPRGAAEPQKLPIFAPYLDDSRIRKDVWKEIRGDEKMKLVSLEGFLNDGEEKYFYTDHHYNNRGAYLAARDYQRSRGLDLPDIYYYSPVTVGNNFRGTLYRSAPLYIARYDRMTMPSRLPSVTIVNKYGYDGRLGAIDASGSLYEPEYMFTSDKYSVYMGGNHGLSVITNNDVQSGPTLLMIKDSFANSAVPYLISSYKRIIMIDLRYYGGKSLLTEMKVQNPDRVVVWYETLDYATETRFTQLLR